MENYKTLKKLRPNKEYGELLRNVASKIEILEEPISSEMIEQIKELSERAIKQGKKQKIQKDNDKRNFFKELAIQVCEKEER